MLDIHRIAPLGTALLTLAAATGCGDGGDGPTGPGDNSGTPLTVAESQAIVGVVLNGGLGAIDFGSLSSAVPAGSLVAGGIGGLLAGGVPVNEQLDVTASCTLGGSAKVNGSVVGDVDEQTGAADAVVNIDIVHQGCKASEGGQTYVIDGNPKMNLNFDISLSQTAFSMDGRIAGNVKWSRDDGGAGTCSINLALVLHESSGGGSDSASLNGTACGHAVAESE